VILSGALEDLPELIAAQGQGEVRFDVIVGRNTSTRHPDKAAAARVIAGLLGAGGRLSLAEAVPRHAQRLYRLVDLSALDEDLRHRLVEAEEAIYADRDDPMLNWDASDLEAAFQSAGLSDVHVQVEAASVQQHVGPEHLARWFGASPDRQRPSYAGHLSKYLSAAELAQVQTLFEHQFHNQTVAWTSQVVHLSARK
jgi:putative ATPase